MKLTRSRVLIILLVLGLIVVYTSLLSSYVNQKNEQRTLRDQTDTAVKTSSLLPPTPADTQKRLAEAQKAYDAALAAVSTTDIDSTQVMEALITTATEYNLTVNPAVTAQWTQKTFGLATYRILPFRLEIRGSYHEITNYVKQLEDQTQFPYLAIEGLKMVETSPNTGTSGNDEQLATLDLNIVIRQAPKS
jgi:Tfp pilus assembly protein PilO